MSVNISSFIYRIIIIAIKLGKIFFFGYVNRQLNAQRNCNWYIYVRLLDQSPTKRQVKSVLIFYVLPLYLFSLWL